MKICFYTNSFFPHVGGAQMVLHNLATRLMAHGVEVVVLAPYIRGRDNLGDFPYPVYRYAKPSSRRFAVRQTLVHLAWLYWRHRFQLLHCHAAYPAAYVGATFKRLFGVPLVVRPYGGDDIRPAGRVRRRPRLAQRLYQALGAADAVIAQGRFVQGTILELGVDPSRLYVINNGIDLKAFSVGTAFPHPRPYILGLGSLAWHKGFDVLLRAYARLQPPVPDLLLAGHGSVRPALETLAQQLRIASRVTFLGFVGGQDKINLLRSAQLFVSPSRREAFSNVILEALAAGLPVIASAVGGNPELVPHGQHGLLVPPEDDVALARALQTVLHHPAQLATMRAAVPAFVQAFDWPIITQAYLDLYRTLVR